MLSWAQKQRILTVAVPFGFFLLVAGGALLVSRNGPTCGDGRRNGSETGVDCGGSCRLLCTGETVPIITHFARPVRVGGGAWGAVAYLENRNTAYVREAPFFFKLFDSTGLLIGERHGIAYLPPHKTFAIFEGRFSTGGRTPVRAVFELDSLLRFESSSEEPLLEVRAPNFDISETLSRLGAEAVNPLGVEVGPIEFTALLFDESGNVFAASATRLQRLSARNRASIAFTWPEPLPRATRTEILYTFPQ